MKRSGMVGLSHGERTAVQEAAAGCMDAAHRTRCLIVLRSAEGWGRAAIAAALSCSPALVSKVRKRWQAEGLAGLIDRREDNGDQKATEDFVRCVAWVLTMSPRDFDLRRPTWTRRLPAETAAQYTGTTVSVTTMGRVLRLLRARRGRPKPLAPCPWSGRARARRVHLLHRLIDTLPCDEACVWEDEADIDLNPRIGPDWMLPGTQRTVMTPGKNVKRYAAAGMDARTDRVAWVTGRKKDSGLFIAMLARLLRVYADKRVVHVILDNYTIHTSSRTRAGLGQRGQRIRLHFLPPYCPDDNRIERKVWREVHANVTYNHRCQNIDDLMHEVSFYLRAHNRRHATEPAYESRRAILCATVRSPYSSCLLTIHGQDPQPISCRRRRTMSCMRGPSYHVSGWSTTRTGS